MKQSVFIFLILLGILQKEVIGQLEFGILNKFTSPTQGIISANKFSPDGKYLVVHSEKENEGILVYNASDLTLISSTR